MGACTTTPAPTTLSVIPFRRSLHDVVNGAVTLLLFAFVESIQIKEECWIITNVPEVARSPFCCLAAGSKPVRRSPSR